MPAKLFEMDESSLADAKRRQRREMRQRRVALVDRPQRSVVICDGVMQLCVRVGPRVVMAFVGVGTEPGTDALLRLLFEQGYEVGLPRVEGDHIVAVEHRVDSALVVGSYGIPEPVGNAIDPNLIDLVLVPGLAFTRDGRRLGQGGGFYDRFLPLLREDCMTCGVCFDVQIVDELPIEPHDQTMTFVITDRTSKALPHSTATQ